VGEHCWLHAAKSSARRLRRRRPDEAELVDAFLSEDEDIRKTGIATNTRLQGTRFSIATVLRSQSGEAVASIMLVGLTSEVKPRVKRMSRALFQHAEVWSHRFMTPREAI